MLTPGFVDMHTHSDVQLLAHPDHACKVHQGVTLEVLGQDGLALAPTDDATMALLRAQLAGWNGAEPELDDSWRSVAEYLARFDGTTAVNVCYLLPHATLRLLTVGADDRAATADELDAMRALVRQGLAEGAVGLSAGLTYAPGMYATDDELVELCRELRGGAYYCPHHRNYGLHAIKGYADSIEIARRAGVPLHLAHAHLGFACNRGRAGELLALIDGARADGVDVTLDTYPYLAGATYLHALLPGWVHAGGPEAIIARLRDPDLRERLRVELEETGSDGFHDVPVEWDTVVLDGVTIADLAAREGKRPIDVYCERCADSRPLGVGTRALRQRGERARDHAAPRAHRRQRRHPRRRTAPPARLGDIRALPRRLRARARRARPVGVRAPHDVPARTAPRPGRPRPRATRHGSRHHGLRSRMACTISPPTRSRAASHRDSSTWPSTASWCSTAVRTPAPRRGARCGARPRELVARRARAPRARGRARVSGARP